MHSYVTRACALAIAAAGLLAACVAQADSQPAGSGKVPCSAPGVKVPGEYLVLASVGKFENGGYVSNSFSWWSLVRYEAAGAGTKPTPSPTPRAPLYAYYGTYTLDKHKQTGCAYLFVTQTGQPFPGLNGANALSSGAPMVKQHFHATVTAVRGSLSVRLNGVTDTSGTGSMTLTQGGAAYDTGTIVLTGRTTMP